LRFIVVITGPSEGGLGAQTAIFLAHGHPSSILLLGRTQSKAESVIHEVKSISPDTTVEFININLASFASIRAAALVINSSVTKIDVLINNAGIMGVKDYTLTKDGLESQFGCNHIGHFLLTNLLMPKILLAGKGSRIVNLTSVSHQTHEMRLDDYNFDNGKAYDPWLAYGQSKTANILFTAALAEKLKEKGLLSFAVHPGTVMTNLASEIDPSQWVSVRKLFSDRGK
jgi:NAD(P)-dependent dehydrogenase (short-subunit alcohol dehydrogenase family)